MYPICMMNYFVFCYPNCRHQSAGNTCFFCSDSPWQVIYASWFCIVWLSHIFQRLNINSNIRYDNNNNNNSNISSNIPICNLFHFRAVADNACRVKRRGTINQFRPISTRGSASEIPIAIS